MAGTVRFYLEREIDRRALEAVRDGLQSSFMLFWITLVSAPGRGNTCLLTHLQRQLQRDYAFQNYEVLLVYGSDTRPTKPPRLLGPLAFAILHKVKSLGTFWFRKLQRRLREASFGQLARCLAMVVGCILVASLLAGLSEYVTNAGGRSFQNFCFVYIPQNWRNFPLWLLAGSAVSLPLSLIVLYISREFMLPARIEEPSEDEAEEFLSADGLSAGLQEIAHGKSGVIILVDDVQWLKPIEISFLNDQLGVSPKTDTRVIVVALDSEGTDWRARFPDGQAKQFVTLEVPPFDLFELQSLWNAHEKQGLSRPQDRLSETEMLEQAQGSVKALLSFRDLELIEELGSEFRKVQGKDIGNVFGLSALMAFQVARQIDSVKKAEILEWLEELNSSGDLAEFGWRAHDSPQSVILEFSGSTLVRTSDDICRFDPQRRSALLNWLQQHHQPLMAKVHYFWFRSLLRKVPLLKPHEMGQLSETERHDVRSAAWFAMRIVLFADDPSVFLQQAILLSPGEMTERCFEVANVLLAAAAISRSDGDLLESRSLTMDAFDWIRGAGSKSTVLASQAVDQLWRCYWLSGELQFCEQISELLKEFPEVEKVPGSAVHRRYEGLLQGRGSIPASLSGLLDPFLSNLNALTDSLEKIRQNHGFLQPGLADESIPLPKPTPSSSDLIPEFELWSLNVRAACERSRLEDLRDNISEWRIRLLRGALPPSGLGEQAAHDLAIAFYYHNLADALRSTDKKSRWMDSRDSIEDSEPASTLEDNVRAACLSEVGPEVDLQEHLWRESKAAYQRALQVGVLFHWRVLMLKSYFGLAMLLEQHTPESLRSAQETWWESWDALFNYCVELEKDLGWVYHRPILHYLRHKFFADEGRESSVEDAYNTFLATKAANYPAHVVLEWHQKVAGLLNDYGNSELDRRRSAELHEIWARELAALPEAEELRRFRVLRYERAHGLLFAAQALRILREVPQADRLLDEADDYLLSSAAEPGELVEDEDRLRELGLSLQLQRAWVREGQGRQDDHNALVYDLWRKIRRTDADCGIVLRSLVYIEYRDGRLDSPWPPEPELPPLVDPENSDLSLTNFPTTGGEIRYEFRLRQFLSLLHIDVQPNLPQLMLLARLGWWGQGKSFGETALAFADLGTKLPLRPESRGIIIDLLQAVWFFFAEVVEVETDELRTLQLLMHYAPDQLSYHQKYAEALIKNQHLLKRELAVQEGTEHLDWLALATRINTYLGVLVDDSLREQWIGRALQGAGSEVPELLGSLKKREEALRLAQDAFASGSPTESLRLLSGILPPEKPVWIFLEDLQVVDLWIRSYMRVGAASLEELTQRSNQLRQLAIRFVHQFAGTIGDEQVQRLAFDLVEMARNRKGVSSPSGSVSSRITQGAD